VLILWGWTALLSGFVLWPTYSGNGDAIVPIGVLALGLLLFMVLHPRLRASPAGVTDSGVAGGGVGD
jgi:UDP-GlcNAc:undecaprenyl-phosphate GlcNAc-1-phosphate transferase